MDYAAFACFISLKARFMAIMFLPATLPKRCSRGDFMASIFRTPVALRTAPSIVVFEMGTPSSSLAMCVASTVKSFPL